jgi:hypothetical protein
MLCCGLQVNQEVVQQVQARGEANVNIADLTSEVVGKLNMAGARSKRLQRNNADMEAASSYAKNMSAFADMSAVRSEWSKGGRPEESESPFSYAVPPDAVSSVFGAGHPPPPPMAGAPMMDGPMSRSGGGFGASRSRRSAPQSAMMMDSAPPAAMFNSAPAVAMETYDAVEGEVQFEQAERMVQRALRQNKINLPSAKK